MTSRRRLVTFGIVILLATVCGRAIDVRQVAGRIKGDEATYIAMALSLANDGDLRYEPRDYERFKALYGTGPSGIFLKQRYEFGFGTKTPVDTTRSLAYGKALIYPLVASPFVLVGGLGGLLVFNWALLGLCLFCGAMFCRAMTGSRRGWLIAAVFIGASVAPVYTAWMTSEIFNFTLIFVAYFLWLQKKVEPVRPMGARPWYAAEWTTVAAAALIGVATFSKATNAALIGPLVLEALLSRRVSRVAAVTVACAVGITGLFGLNAIITGEANYQGASDGVSRRYFIDHYPFDAEGTTFATEGNAMITNDADTGRVLANEALEQVPVNVWYFLVGRDAGLVPYFLPGVVMALAWVSRARRAPVWQWATAVAIAGSIGALVVLFPDSWNGGGGAPGNRYFLSLYPTLLFLAPTALPLWPSLVALAGGVAFTGALVAHPYSASATPWLNPERRPLNWLPIELTLVNDLPCRLNELRCPILFIREPTVQFYYMDGRTYSAERSPGSNSVDGTWIAGAASTDIIVKTDLPPSRVRIEFSAPIDNEVTGSFADQSFRATVPAGGKAAIAVSQPTAFRYHQNSVYVLHLSTAHGFVPAERDPGSKDTRNLGVFIRPTFSYDDVSREGAVAGP